MAFTLIGGTAVGTVLTLMFLPALYSVWFGVKPTTVPNNESEVALVRS
jgi:Cu/Ag efflux pump CusA